MAVLQLLVYLTMISTVAVSVVAVVEMSPRPPRQGGYGFPTAYSCKQLDLQGMPTGEYHILLRSSYTRVRVWCEMSLGTGNGGYTFLHPTEMYKLTVSEQTILLAQIYTHTGDVLLRVRKNDGRQPYTVLKQLARQWYTPLYVGMSRHIGYVRPGNTATMINPFIYLGFIPASDGWLTGSTQGMTANNRQCTFRYCGANPASYIALFPNLMERPALNYRYAPDGWGTTGPCGCIRNSLRHNPSGHVMPRQYFMFTELHFGGCGCYGQTDSTSNVMLGSALGFR